MRRAGFAFFGIFNGTEFNPTFFEDIEKAVDNEKGAVLVCSIGGILEPLGRGGRQSRYALMCRRSWLVGREKHWVSNHLAPAQ